MFCFVGTHVCYICWRYQPLLIVSLFLTDKKINRVLVSFSIFLLFEKMHQKNWLFQMLAVAFGESTVSRTQVQLWYNRLKEGREDVKTMHVLARPSTSTAGKNIKAVKKKILNNRWITIREVADEIGISFGSCQVIFTDVLGMKRAGFAPW